MNDDINDDDDDEKPLAATPLAATTTTTKNDDDERVDNNTSNCAFKNANDANTFNEKAQINSIEPKSSRRRRRTNSRKRKRRTETTQTGEQKKKRKRTKKKKRRRKNNERGRGRKERGRNHLRPRGLASLGRLSFDQMRGKRVRVGKFSSPFRENEYDDERWKTHTDARSNRELFERVRAGGNREKMARDFVRREERVREAAKRLREYAEKEAPKVEANVGDDFRTSWKKRRGGEVPRLISGEGEEEDEEDNAAAVNFFKDAELFILTLRSFTVQSAVGRNLETTRVEEEREEHS